MEPKTIKHLDDVLHQVGYGKYPYDCEQKRKHPKAMIYESETCWLADINDTEVA